jgi:predicted nuclease with TOPRIM domain
MRPRSIETRKNFSECDKPELIDVVKQLQIKLKSKKDALQKVRTKLSATRTKLIKLKDTVIYQRKRILELYPDTQSVLNIKI